MAQSSGAGSRFVSGLGAKLNSLPRGRIYLALAAIATFAFFALLGASWSGVARPSSFEVILLALIAGGSLFELRREAYLSRNTRVAAASFAFLDASTYYALVALVVWGFIFPVIRQVPADYELWILYDRNLSMSLYAGMLVAGLVIAFRVAIQPVISRASGPTAAELGEVTQKLSILLAQLGTQVDMKGGPKEDGLRDRLSVLGDELATIRSELGRLRPGAAQVYVPATRPAGPSARGAVWATDRSKSSGGSDSLTYERPESVRSAVDGGSSMPGALPDAASENPWLAVLASRGKQNPGTGTEGKEKSPEG
jgi:hypothetical protein